MFLTPRTIQLPSALLIAAVMFGGWFSGWLASPAAAQGPEERLEILEHHLARAERQLVEARESGNERAAREARVLVDALRLALEVERQIARRGGDGRDRVEKPEPREAPRAEQRLPRAVDLLRHVAELDGAVREAMERGDEAAERELREKFNHVSEEVAGVFEQWLQRVRGDEARQEAQALLLSLREAWSAGRQDQAFQLAQRFDDLMAKLAGGEPDRGQPEPPARSLAQMIEKLLHVDRALREAEESGRADEAERLRNQYRELAQAAEAIIRRAMERLAPAADDRHARAERLLERLGNAMEESSNDALSLAKELDRLFGTAGGGGDRERDIDREREREMDRMRQLEFEQMAARMKEELAMLEAHAARLKAEIAALTESGDTERVLDLMAEHKRIRETIENLQAQLKKLLAERNR